MGYQRILGWIRLGLNIRVAGILLVVLVAVSCDRNGVTVLLADPLSSQSVSHNQRQDILSALTEADVAYLGEIHAREADHTAQLEIIQSLYQANPNLAIALEMFQRPFQPVLDAYIAGEISETELRQQSEYDARWGFDWEFYAPILRLAREHQIPLLALNTPTEVTRQVAQKGLNSLSESERQWIPPLSEIDTSNGEYRQYVQEIFQGHHGQSEADNFDNFFAAQVLWDETMAETIATYATAHPDRQIVVLVGQGHIIYDYGIPVRVERRTSNLVQRTVLLNPDPEAVEAGTGTIADYFWISPSP